MVDLPLWKIWLRWLFAEDDALEQLYWAWWLGWIFVCFSFINVSAKSGANKKQQVNFAGVCFSYLFFLEFVWVDFWHDTSWYVWFRLAGFKAHDRVWQVHFNWQEEVEWCGCPPKHVAPQQEHLPLQVVASEGDVSSFNHAVLRVEFSWCQCIQCILFDN